MRFDFTTFIPFENSIFCVILNCMKILVLLFSMMIQLVNAGPVGFYDHQVHDLSGNEVTLKKYAGKVLLVVNTASQCGYTPQYAGLQKLYEQNHDKGFEVLAFPSNDFGGQEPGSAPEIKKFCETRYHVKFALFEKGPVSGKNKQALYQWLLKQDLPGKGTEVAWNFEKFLISKKGTVVARYLSGVSPESDEIKKAVEAELQK